MNEFSESIHSLSARRTRHPLSTEAPRKLGYEGAPTASTEGASRRRSQREATHEEILLAAVELFGERGFDAVGLADIAARVGIRPSTIVLHFGDKRGLLCAVLWRDLERLLAEAEKQKPKGTLLESYRALAKRFFDFYAGRPALSRVLLEASLLAPPPWGQRFVAQAGRAHAVAARLAHAAVERGELPRATDVVVLGATFLSFFYFALLSWVQGAHPEPLSFCERLLATHLAGLRGDTLAPKETPDR
jgi:AcrR family transcriptional regulator